MSTLRQLFLSRVAQTTDFPLLLEIERAEGIYLYDTKGKQYIDLISGISVSNVGHCHPKVVKAVQEQAEKFMFLMVYGEYVYAPHVRFADYLCKQLPSSLDRVYFVNSGSEAVEGAMKTAKKYTGRAEIIHFKNSYHGSSHGALSVMGNEYFKNPFRPLLPGIKALEYNNPEQLDEISTDTACVIAEPVQAESGIHPASEAFMKKLRKKCDETGALLILDEIQTGMGRTGTLFAFEQYGIVPDILLSAKSLGGGMPIGAFITSSAIMSCLKENPILGHITTFGGHPVSCRAGHAALEILLEEGHIDQVEEKGKYLENLLQHPSILAKRRKGLMMSLEFENFEQNKRIIDACIEKGVVTDWFLFSDKCMRIGPPLIISFEQLKNAAEIIIKAIEQNA
ncbi:MAG: aspartate aminotransferase family protein [Chitinophagales bacterium]